MSLDEQAATPGVSPPLYDPHAAATRPSAATATTGTFAAYGRLAGRSVAWRVNKTTGQ